MQDSHLLLRKVAILNVKDLSDSKIKHIQLLKQLKIITCETLQLKRQSLLCSLFYL